VTGVSSTSWAVVATGTIYDLASDGTYLYASTNAGIYRLPLSNPSAGTGSVWSPLTTTGAGLAVTSGHIYISTNGATITQIPLASPSGGTVIAGGAPGFGNGSGTSAQFNNIRGLAMDGNRLYIGDQSNNRIRTAN
jgi:hypothetical protein